MLNKDGQRELAYVVKIDNIEPIIGSDNCEAAIVGGWRVMVRKGTFKPGDLAIYFEIDSKVPEKVTVAGLPKTEPFAFLAKKHYMVKTQKYTFGGKGCMISQGLLMHPNDFGWTVEMDGSAPCMVVDSNPPKENNFSSAKDKGRTSNFELAYYEGDFLTEALGVTYFVQEDNYRKARSADKYKLMSQRHPALFKKPFFRWMMKRDWGKKVLFIFFGKKKDNCSVSCANDCNVSYTYDSKTHFPTHFNYVHKTDQERCENMTWILNDKTPYIRTQKCDGSSATYIIERKSFGKFEFYVCSRNVRMLFTKQESFHNNKGENNIYWKIAKKYDIELKLQDYLQKHPDLQYVCWQGEICGPNIQNNPHQLSELHLFCFHMIDSKQGKYDIRDAKKIWDEYTMETVPIDENLYILPDDFEEFKLSADGNYSESVCNGNSNCCREGFVYYKTTDPNFSFKNVSRDYLIRNKL